jgi:hypothetical protein
MTRSSTQAKPTLIDRYQDYRTRRFLKNERTYARALPRWRTQRRRRLLVVGLSVTFVFMFAVSLLCALYFPLWIVLQIVSGRQGDAPQAALDEYEVQQRNSARSIALTLTQNLMLIPSFYLIFGAVITGGTDVDMAYAGGLMSLTVLSIGACTPAMILGWSRPDPDA